MLDGVVVAAVALLAGAQNKVALTLAVGMTLLQLGIGTVNDVVDAPRDRGHKPGKPIVAGLVEPRHAVALAAACFAGGVALSLSVDLMVAGLALAVIAIGLSYDLWLKGTSWSWVPFAVGIPILPVFGWLGARGSLAPAFAVLIPVAILAGAGLAIANAAVDVERDRAAGATSLSARLGPRRAGDVEAGLFALVWLLAFASAAFSGADSWTVGALAALGAVPVGASRWAAARPPAARERAWQIETISLAALAATWIWALGARGGLG